MGRVACLARELFAQAAKGGVDDERRTSCGREQLWKQQRGKVVFASGRPEVSASAFLAAWILIQNSNHDL